MRSTAGAKRVAGLAGAVIALAVAVPVLGHELSDPQADPAGQTRYSEAGCDGSTPVRDVTYDYFLPFDGAGTPTEVVEYWLAHNKSFDASREEVSAAITDSSVDEAGLDVRLPGVTLSLMRLPDDTFVVAGAVWC